MTPAQAAAVAYVRDRAAAATKRAERRVRKAAPGTPVTDLLDGVRRHGRLCLNFHPDRVATDGRTAAHALFDDGIYRSQFETGTSAGSRTAFAGGERDGWERALFGDAYDGAPAEERPRYGGLDLAGHADGPCPRFGSCHLVLRPELGARTTFTYGDSHTGPADVGTADCFTPVLAALVEDGNALRRWNSAAAVVEALLGEAPVEPTGNGRALDHYIEAQVHSVVELATDVAVLAIDPSFAGTETGSLLEKAADRWDVAIVWTPGFALSLDAVDEEFRGPALPPFAARVAAKFAGSDGIIDAAVIGRAAATVDPDDLATLQLVKQLWHTTVEFG